ncbi:hypothetical protein [Arthrobacter sp. H20]|uniref:hypothetical protein n=1 Tax=Arthrobacter sp. H20 TaxID=1267981 RepID=UPI00047C820D|nr:hypothetical protein [Arthrobacter sp. H20]
MLVDVIDGKDVFVVAPQTEIPDEVIDSVKEVRRIATSTVSLVESLEVMEEVRHIETACKTFMRDYHKGDDVAALATGLEALRADVGESVAFLAKVLKLRGPSRFDVSPYEPRATEILQGWLK